MAKINTTVLPTATEEYEALQFDTLIRILEQITQQLNFGFQEDLKEEANKYLRVLSQEEDYENNDVSWQSIEAE